MANLNIPSGERFTLDQIPSSFMLRLGRREATVSRDFRRRYYRVNPIIDCNPGSEPGHLEVLLFRKWLLVFSKAH